MEVLTIEPFLSTGAWVCDRRLETGGSMKIAILFLSSFFALVAHAEVTETTVQCLRSSKESCSLRTVDAFQKVGCNPLAQSVQCQDAATDPMVDPSEIKNVKGKDFCTIESDCHEPHYGNFGQVSCSWIKAGEQTLNLRDIDPEITLTTSVGLFRRYVTTLCK
jgi:hypothetical protein